MATISTGKAAAIRKGINLGRLMSVEAELSLITGETHDGWRRAPLYSGLFGRAYRKALDRSAEAEFVRSLRQYP